MPKPEFHSAVEETLLKFKERVGEVPPATASDFTPQAGEAPKSYTKKGQASAILADQIFADLQALQKYPGSFFRAEVHKTRKISTIKTNIPFKKGAAETTGQAECVEIPVLTGKTALLRPYPPQKMSYGTSRVLGFGFKNHFKRLTDRSNRERLVKTLTFLAARQGLVRAES